MSASSGTHKGLTRILLIEDDLALVRGLKGALETHGCVVRATNRGANALETALEFHPDLILLDVMMPGVDGWEVLSHLRENSNTSNVPVIMLTATDSNDAKIKGFTLGADDYVTKPFSVEELRCRIAAVLRRSQPDTPGDETCYIPVISGESGTELVRCKDVYFVEGIRNFTYVHTLDGRHLSRLTLGALDKKGIETFMRVHRSFIVNLEHVKSCGWISRSAYRIRLSNVNGTEIQVSRPLISEVQRRLGLKS